MLELVDVTKAYPPRVKGGEALWALGMLNLAIAEGEFVTIVGPSGCGKTTLLNLAAGFERPTAGSVLLNGTVVRGPGPERAVVFQQPALFPWMSVVENMAFGLTLRGRVRQAEAERLEAMVDVMGLTGFENHWPYQLSGGMQQRVAIARALITEPQVLLMDEPFGSLDSQTRSDMQRFLLSIWKNLAPTVLFVTHDVEEAIMLADRVVVMTARPGRIAETLSVTLPRPRQWEVTLGRAFNEYKREILRILRSDDRSTRPS